MPNDNAYQCGYFGNASSRTHPIGIQVRKKVEQAREHVAELLGLEGTRLIFSSGATESANILIERLSSVKTLWMDNTSHPCVRRHGLNLSEIHSNDWRVGILVNNETGIIDFSNSKILDVTQGVAKVRPEYWQTSTFIFGSAHKFHAPLGIGFIGTSDVGNWELIRENAHLSQERGIRPGTLNAPAIIQTGEVAKWMLKNGDEYRAKLKHLQSTFENKIKSLTDCWIIGADQERAPHITSLNLPGVDNEALIAAVNDRLAIASGSACTSEKVEPSHVLMAMFNDREIADTTVRISYGWFNTEAEVLEAAEIIAKAAETIRSFSL